VSLVAAFATALLVAARAAADDPAATPEGGDPEPFLDEVNKQLTNPVSSRFSHPASG
jgi:hypothetical protein